MAASKPWIVNQKLEVTKVGEYLKRLTGYIDVEIATGAPHANLDAWRELRSHLELLQTRCTSAIHAVSTLLANPVVTPEGRELLQQFMELKTPDT